MGLPANHESIKRRNPDFDIRKLQANLEKLQADLSAAGYDYSHFAPETEEAVAQLSEKLKERKPHWDGVMFGFGYRGNPEMTVLFEELVNCVRTQSPDSKILFNSSPESTVDAAKRNFPL